ncbi:cupin domain-containing protein [Pseudomonas cavernae]|uniref:cupin domain-containing protein n=1 Tax=Pseudomonas cavernae TaxID=2320867 RepID=UPI001EE52FA2|nr:cupin domain-containing protein [Pseudomonas cavernae]
MLFGHQSQRLGPGQCRALARGGAGDAEVTPLAAAKLPAIASAQAKALRVDFAPGAESRPHSHPGPVFVVVASGAVESALDGGAVQRFKAGDAWYEAPGQLHRITRNASQTQPASLVPGCSRTARRRW